MKNALSSCVYTLAVRNLGGVVHGVGSVMSLLPLRLLKFFLSSAVSRTLISAVFASRVPQFGTAAKPNDHNHDGAATSTCLDPSE